MYFSNNRTAFSSLAENTVCDVLIIGGGATGLLCAYKLYSKGLKVVLIEKNVIASGKTAYNCGLLFDIGSPSYNDLYLRYKDRTQFALNEYSESFDRFRKISEIVKDLSFMRVKALYYTDRKSHNAVSSIKQEYQKRFFRGERCSFLTWKDAMKMYSFDISCGILTNSAAQHNPVRFCESLADYLSLNGVEIYENTEIINVKRLPSDKIFTSSSLNGKTVTSFAIIDCRGSKEICCKDLPFVERTSYYAVSAPIDSLTGWYCGSVITDDSKCPLYLRLDEQNRIVAVMRVNNILSKIGSVYDNFMYRYLEDLLKSMFFGMKNLKIEAAGKHTCQLPKDCICGVKRDRALEGFFYICSNNTVSLQDSEIMAEKMTSEVVKFCLNDQSSDIIF